MRAKNENPADIKLPMPIKTPRLIIRPPQKDESQALFDAIQESLPQLSPWLVWSRYHQSLVDTQQYTAQAMEKWMDRAELPMRVFDREDGSFIGGSGFVSADWQVGAFEIGYWVRASRHGEGLISEAVTAVTRWAFDALEANRVCIRADVDNTRSRAIPERLGFALEGIMRNDALSPAGDLRDTALYARITADGLPALDVTWGGEA